MGELGAGNNPNLASVRHNPTHYDSLTYSPLILDTSQVWHCPNSWAKLTCTKVWKRESFFCRDLITSKAKGWLLQKVAAACFRFSSPGPLNCAKKPTESSLDTNKPGMWDCKAPVRARTQSYSAAESKISLAENKCSYPTWIPSDQLDWVWLYTQGWRLLWSHFVGPLTTRSQNFTYGAILSLSLLVGKSECNKQGWWMQEALLFMHLYSLSLACTFETA